MTAEHIAQARKYCRRIRNKHKRTYALKLFHAMTAPTHWPTPPRPRELGVMGAQAVEMNLRDILAGRD